MLTRSALTVVCSFVASAFLSSCAAGQQEQCTEPPRVLAVRDDSGASGAPVQAGSHVTCDGTTTGNELAMAGGWPTYIAPLGGAGPLEASVPSSPDSLVADYTPYDGTASLHQLPATTRAIGNGRFEIDAPPHAGCWLLGINVGAGWAMLIDTGLPGTPHCSPTA